MSISFGVLLGGCKVWSKNPPIRSGPGGSLSGQVASIFRCRFPSPGPGHLNLVIEILGAVSLKNVKRDQLKRSIPFGNPRDPRGLFADLEKHLAVRPEGDVSYPNFSLPVCDFGERDGYGDG